MENTALWDKLGKTDPAHTKTFKRAGGFSGTAIKPMFSYRRLTEEFGPCGSGWGVNEPVFQVVPGQNNEVLVFCTVSGWYMLDGQAKTVYGVGGDKVVTYIKANEQYNRPERWENDDEAFKKAFTDALTNAFKLVGVGADVHMGMFDDNKYVNSMRAEFSGQQQNQNDQANQSAGDTSSKPSAAHQKRQLDEIEKELLDCHSVITVNACAETWKHIANRDGWSRDYKQAASEKFETRRKAVQEAA
ncbi:hypothetical protein [Agrobacterium sp.]|uniref:hypothetical protein n=1 Tax=Agrobacterium sp. TaxID=361 RepID=UPI0025BDFAA5|nr:hypothetical protein [Agrobacterium sp.]MCD4663371.1 hypothetical protein [Agrobacterium sp.]